MRPLKFLALSAAVTCVASAVCVWGGTASALGAQSHGPTPQLSQVMQCRADRPLDKPAYLPDENDRREYAAKAREGRRLFQSGDFIGAVKIFTQAIALEPSDALAYYHRGIAHQKLRAYSEALADFTIAIEKGPEVDSAYLNRGAVRTKLGMNIEAEADFDAALKIEPTRPDTYLNRALLFLKTNRVQHAIDDVSKAISLNPGDAKPHYLRASILEMSHRHPEVRFDLQRALELDPNFFKARELLLRMEQE